MTRPSLSQRTRAVLVGNGAPPAWYIRLFGAGIIVADAYFWLGEGASPTLLEFLKHGLWLLIGMRFFYPEAARFVVGSAARIYTHRRHDD